MSENTRIYKKILKTIGLTILSLFLLVILTVIIVLNSSFFQNKVVDWAGDFLKNRYDIELSVDDISFKPFNHLYIKKLLLSTGAVDSMIYVSEGQLDFNANPFRLLRGNFVLSGIDADSVKIRLVSNYTPRLEDTTGGAGFQFIFSPADIDVRHVDFRLQDTVRRMEVLAKSGRLQAKIHASNLQNEFTMQNIVLQDPAVTVFGAQKGSGEDPYIRKLWEDFRKANGIELSESERDTLFWDLSFDVNSLDVTNGSVNLYSYDSIGGGYKPPFSVSGITGHIGHVVTEPNHIVVGPFEAGFKMNDDLIVDQFSFDQLEMTDKFVRVRNLDLDYGQSKLGGELTFRYNTPSELGQFKDKVMIDIQIPQGRVYLEDLGRLLPGMKDMSFMRQNIKDAYDLSLTGSGTLDNMTLSNWRVGEGNTFIRGSGQLTDILQPDRRVTARIANSRVPVYVIKQKFPGINLPSGVDSLEYVNLTGNINLRGKRVNVDTRINTELGKVHVLAAIDLLNKKYDGSLKLDNFDLGRFIQNPNIGKLSMAIQLEEGTEFDLEELSGHLQTTVDSIYFNGFKYSNISLNGFFGNNGFLGHIAMNQPEIAFDLDTKIDFTRITDIVAYGHIHHSNLRALNLTQQNIKLSSQLDIEMTAFPIDSLNGYARINDLELIRDDTVFYNMDVITFDARSWGDNFKDWRLISDILSVDIDGQFNIENILGTTYEIIASRHPRVVRYLPEWELKTDSIYNNDFTMIIDVNDTEEFANLINPELDTIRNLNLSLTYRNRGADYFEYYFQASAPKIQFKDVGVESLNINASGSNTDNEWIVYLDSLNAGGVRVGTSQLQTRLVGDQFDFALKTNTINNMFNDIQLAGFNRFDANDAMTLSLDSSSFTLLNSIWALNPNNSIEIGKNKLFFDNFVFQSGERNLFIQSATDQSLIAGLRNLDIQFLNGLFPGNKFTFGGIANVILSVENINDLTGLEVETVIDGLMINKEPFGRLNSLFYTLGSDELATVEIQVEKDGRESLSVDGQYDLFNTAGNKVPRFEFGLRATQFPILVLEFFIGNIIDNTKGYVNAEINLTSDGDQPDIAGRVLINGQTDIPLLGTTYEFINSSVDIDNQLIAFDEINMMDTEGNLANASGGIRHDHLRNFRMDTEVTTEKFLLLSTGKTAGMPFYGRGVGSATIEIRGPFNQLNMSIQAETGPTSQIAIPISSTISVSDEEAFFIDFVSDDSFEEVLATDDNSFVQIEGLNLAVNLTLTPDCEVSIILDESTGDILRARGNSELLIELTRAGNFTMRGTYEVVSGEYQFAQLNFTRKMFRINQGGTITWTGDPLNAQIDIDASYSVRTPPYNFILEYIGQNDRLAELAQNATDVDLFLHLRGDLFAPDITFDMEFPELTGQVRNYVEDRLRVIADDQNEINKQVFGLLIARSFIPSVSSVVNIDGTVVNTVSEVITNQLSFFLTQYLQESIDEVPFISSVELNIGYNVYRNNYTAEAQAVVKTGNEFVVQPEIGFLDNRLQVTMEANLQTGSAVTSNTLITHDFVVEYSITEDNRLIAKLYQRTEPYVFEKTSKLGVGLTYQKEFDKFYEFLRGKESEESL